MSLVFTKNALERDMKLAKQYAALNQQRDMFNVNQAKIQSQYAHTLSDAQMAGNAALGKDFWYEIDRANIRAREQAKGIEILNDLASVTTTLNVGKTAYGYRSGSNIAKDVSVSIDGHKPFSYDHTDGEFDADPIPVFLSGFGANWRHVEANRSVDYDLIADSQEAKMIVHTERLVDYVLNGDANIVVDGYAAQGLTNHRNTKKIDLGASGANIDLTTASPADVLAFFTTGAFGTNAQNNRVGGYDVVWVSYAIWNNLRKLYASNGLQLTAMDQIVGFGTVREFRPTFALTGNEFLGYVRRRDVLTMPVGAATGVTAVPRFLPQDNYNFQILTVAGIQVRKQSGGLGGVVYGANL